MLEADLPAKPGEALPFTGPLKVSSEAQNRLPGYDTVIPLTHVVKHMYICSVGEAASFMTGLHTVFLLLHSGWQQSASGQGSAGYDLVKKNLEGGSGIFDVNQPAEARFLKSRKHQIAGIASLHQHIVQKHFDFSLLSTFLFLC